MKYDFFILSVIILILISAFSNAQVVIIANKSIDVKSIDHNTLENLYTLQSNELGSQKVKPVFLTSEDETSKKFVETIGKSLQELKRIWLRAKLTGNGVAPDLIASEGDVLNKVVSTPNMVGFIDQKLINENVKVLFKLP